MTHINTIVRVLVLLSGSVFAMTTAGAGEIVVIRAHGAQPLSKDAVANLYLGRSKDFTPLDLPESSSTRVAFYKKATDRDPPQIKAVWSRIVFTGQGLSPKQVADDAEMKKAVAADPKAIGYIDKASVDSSVTVVLDLH